MAASRRWLLLGLWVGIASFLLPGLAVADDVSREVCAALQRTSLERDLWAYSELVRSPKGAGSTYQVRFASDAEYGGKLQRCADRGWVFTGDDQPGTLFSFRSARDKKPANGRRFSLNIPDGALGKLTGTLAVQLQMSPTGEILGKRVLFATNARLGLAALAKIGDWIKVAAVGAERGTFDDLVYLRVADGSLAAASESHHLIPTPEHGAAVGRAEVAVGM